MLSNLYYKTTLFLADFIEKMRKQTSLNDKLHIACTNGDIKIASKLIDNGADIDSEDCNGDSILHNLMVRRIEPDHRCSVKLKYKDKLFQLLKLGVDINAKDDYDKPILFYACYANDNDLLKKLLKHEADPNFTYTEQDVLETRNNPLSFVISKGYKDLALTLINNGYDLSGENAYEYLNQARGQDMAEVAFEIHKIIQKRDNRSIFEKAINCPNEAITFIRHKVLGLEQTNDLHIHEPLIEEDLEMFVELSKDAGFKLTMPSFIENSYKYQEFMEQPSVLTKKLN